MAIDQGAPPKWIKDANGIRRMSPQYKQWQAQQKAQQQQQQQRGGGPPPPPSIPQAPNAEIALPVVSTVAGIQQLPGGGQAADSVTATMEILQDEDVSSEIGANGQTIMANLQRIFARYEVPIGLLSKLLCISEMQVLEFIVDDSGSMNSSTDSRDPVTGRVMTRWQECSMRLRGMMELIAYLPPTEAVIVRFLNNPAVLNCTHVPGEAPEVYLRRINAALDQVFRNFPQGTTPLRERITESFQRYPPNKPVARYLMVDGNPNGGGMAAHAITQMIMHRPNPQLTPITFISLTDNDEEVAWCKEVDDAAPYTAEIDDYNTEFKEVASEQGPSFPFTYGTYRVCELVAAMDPDLLDALDESFPLTCTTMSNYLGYNLNPQEYQQYFVGFQRQQMSKPVETALDKLKQDFARNWRFNDFLQAPLARNVPAVQQYQQAVFQLKARGH